MAFSHYSVAIYAYVSVPIAEALNRFSALVRFYWICLIFGISLVYRVVSQQQTQVGLDIMLNQHTKTLLSPFLQTDRKQSPVGKNWILVCKEFSEHFKPI